MRAKRNSVTAANTSSCSRPESEAEQQAPLLTLLKSIEERDKETTMKLGTFASIGVSHFRVALTLFVVLA